LSPSPNELNPIFKWRRIEERAHHPQVPKVAVGPKGWLQTDFSILNKIGRLEK